MSVKENIQKIIKGKTTQGKIEKDLGLASRTISSWERGMPSVENLIAVADYLNVSTDLILGREAKTDDEETALIAKYRLLTASQKYTILSNIDFLLSQSPIKKETATSSR